MIIISCIPKREGHSFFLSVPTMGNRESWRDPHPLAAYRWLGIWQAIMACINQLITRFRPSQFAAPRKLSENALVAGKCHQRRRRRRNESKTNRRIKLPNCGRECRAYPDIVDPRFGRVIMSHACPIFCRLSFVVANATICNWINVPGARAGTRLV